MKNLLLMGLVTLAAGMFTACSDSDSDNGGGGIPVENNGYVPVNLPDGLANRKLAGIVKDTNGNPIANVTVTTGSVTAKTNAAGMFTLDQVWVNGNRIIVSFSKEGYFDLTRACDTYQTGTWEVSLIGTNETGRSTTFTTTTTGVADISLGGMTVKVPAGELKDEATGSAYTGNVTIKVAYLSPDDRDFADAMPGGDLQAVRVGGNEAELLSYGMIAVSLTGDGGQKLNIDKDGTGAAVVFPIPTSMKDNPPATIPLWWFNEQTGKWEEDGEAKLVGDHYEGEVKHFSWWNLDYPYQQGTVEGHVLTNEGLPVANVTVHVGQRTTKTNSFGYYRQDVPAGEAFTISVRSEDYGEYGGDALVSVDPLTPYEVKTVDLKLTSLNKITGRLLQDNSPVIGVVTLIYGDKRLPAVVSKYDGTFVVYAPYNYTGAASLDVIAGAGHKTVSLTLDNTDKNLGDITFTSPSPVDGNVISIVPTEAGFPTINLQLPTLLAQINESPDGTRTGEAGYTVMALIDRDDPNYDFNHGLNMCMFELGNTDGPAFAEFMGEQDGYNYDCSRYDCTATNISLNGDKLTFKVSGTGNMFDYTDNNNPESPFVYQSGTLTATIVESIWDYETKVRK